MSRTSWTANARECLRALWPAYLLASVLIFWGFTWSLPDGHFIERSFHPDEVAAVRAVEQIRWPDFNPHWFIWGTALFYQAYVVKMLAALGGLIPVGGGAVLLIGRGIVWASAMGALTCVFLLGRRLFDAWTGRLAAMILAVLPGFIINSHYFKTDLPMTFWLLAAMVAGYRLLDSGSHGYVYWLGLLVGYAASTKYSAGVAFPAGLVFLAMSGKARWTGASDYALSVAAGFFLGTPRALLGPTEFFDGLRTVEQIGRGGACYAAAYGPAWWDYLTRVSRLAMTWPVWIAAAISVVYMAARKGRVLLPVWVFLAAFILLLSADNVRLMRYTVPLLPFAALFIAGSCRELKGLSVIAAQAGFAAVGLVAAYSLLYTISYVRVMTEPDTRIQAGQWIAAHVPRDAPFPVVTTHYAGAPPVQLWGFRKLEIEDDDAAALQNAQSPYVAVSELMTQRDRGERDCGNGAAFFQYIHDRYSEVARFENSQKFLGIDSKEDASNTLDWLYPNTRIVIYKRAN